MTPAYGILPLILILRSLVILHNSALIYALRVIAAAQPEMSSPPFPIPFGLGAPQLLTHTHIQTPLPPFPNSVRLQPTIQMDTLTPAESKWAKAASWVRAECLARWQKEKAESKTQHRREILRKRIGEDLSLFLPTLSSKSERGIVSEK